MAAPEKDICFMDAKTLCLAILSLDDASGYEIRKQVEEGPFQYFQKASYGSIYPALGRLHEQGLVGVREQVQDGRPAKKIYSLTPEGRRVLAEALSLPADADSYRSDFLTQMFFSHLLPPSLIAAHIDSRIDFYRNHLAGMDHDCGCAAPGPRFAHGFGKAVYGAALAYLEANRDRLLSDLAAAIKQENKR